jgi:ABC-2 type transport system ATP-binding protein
MPDKIVEVRGLSRRFGNKQALIDVNYEVFQGRIYGLVGANGAGKTTLIQHLLGLLRTKSGVVRVFGLDPVRDPVGVLGRVGYLSERRDLPDWMTVDELMRYTQAYYPAWDPQYAKTLLASFALDPKKKIIDLSDGMRAQVGLIAAVAHRPDLLLLDEPSSGLDAIVREDILEAIVRTIVDDGRTVVFSSHLLEEVERMSDHVTMIHEGRIVLDAALDTILNSHHRTHVRIPQLPEGTPFIDGAMSLEGGGRSWHVVHECPIEQIEKCLQSIGGRILQSRNATLKEVFVARAGRRSPVAQAV